MLEQASALTNSEGSVLVGDTGLEEFNRETIYAVLEDADAEVVGGVLSATVLPNGCATQSTAEGGPSALCASSNTPPPSSGSTTGTPYSSAATTWTKTCGHSASNATTPRPDERRQPPGSPPEHAVTTS